MTRIDCLGTFLTGTALCAASLSFFYMSPWPVIAWLAGGWPLTILLLALENTRD